MAAVKNCYELALCGSQKFTFLDVTDSNVLRRMQAPAKEQEDGAASGRLCNPTLAKNGLIWATRDLLNQ